MTTSNALKWLGTLGKGLMRSQAPGIAAGALVKFLNDNNVGVMIVTEWVQENKNLWDQIPQNYQSYLKKTARTVGAVDWITTTWFINAIKRDKPAIATLFINWKEGMDWLERQGEDLRQRLTN